MVIGPIGLGIKGIVILSKLVFKYWWVWTTFAIILPGFISSIQMGIEQEDLKIPIHEIGLKIVSADESTYEEVQDFEFESLKKDGPVENINYFFDLSLYIIKNLFTNLWMIFFNFFLLYKIFLFTLGDSSRKLRAVISSIVTMSFLQIMVLGIPFRGIYSLIKFIVTSI